MELSEERGRAKAIDLIKTCLLHYKNRLESYRKEKTKKLGLEFDTFFQDLDNILDKIDQMLAESDLLRKWKKRITPESPLAHVIEYERKLVIRSLDCYKKDLEKMKDEIKKEIGDFDFKKTDLLFVNIENTRKFVESKLIKPIWCTRIKEE